jgi:hypothetical protein
MDTHLGDSDLQSPGNRGSKLNTLKKKVAPKAEKPAVAQDYLSWANFLYELFSESRDLKTTVEGR